MRAPRSFVRCWQSRPGAATAWPELSEPDIRARPNTGICFSGGGSRAYVAALGQLAALRELGLLEEVRYVAGVSGGAWATAVYCFGAGGGHVGEEGITGSILPPEALSWKELRTMCDSDGVRIAGCARAAARSCDTLRAPEGGDPT